MTDCFDGMMRDLLPEYALDVLEAEDRARVEAHLGACDACRAELALLGQVRTGISLGTPRLDLAAIVSALPTPPTAAKPPLRLAPRVRFSRHVWQFAAAAGLVLLAGGGLLMRRSPSDATSRLADSSMVRTPVETTTAAAAAQSDDGITFGGGLSDLTLEELQTLLGQMDSVRTLPSKDPESVTPVIAMNEGGKTL